jgi:hypothetical protein
MSVTRSAREKIHSTTDTILKDESAKENDFGGEGGFASPPEEEECEPSDDDDDSSVTRRRSAAAARVGAAVKRACRRERSSRRPRRTARRRTEGVLVGRGVRKDRLPGRRRSGGHRLRDTTIFMGGDDLIINS